MTLSKYATTVKTIDDLTRVTYHSTDIVAFNDSMIVLDSGSWLTATTKHKMNQASEDFGLGFQVFAKNGDWFVTFNGQTSPFSDGMTLNRKNAPVDIHTMTAREILDTLTKISDAGVDMRITLVAGLPYRIDWTFNGDSKPHRDYPDNLQDYLTEFLANL